MKTLVTGATGFLGEHLCYRLKEEGFQVVGVGRNENKGKELESKGVTFVRTDLSNKSDVEGLLSDIDYVFHSAALSSPWGNYEDFHQANVVATQNLIDEALKEKIERFIHVSTPSIYAHSQDTLGIKEDSQLPEVFINHYATTKHEAEKIVDEAFKKGLKTIAIRPRGIFGPGDTSVIPRLIRANEKLGVPMINKGEAVIDVTYVGNVVEALILCMKSNESTLGKKYNITNGEPTNLHDLLSKVFTSLDMEWKQKHMDYKTLQTAAGFIEFLHKNLFKKTEPVLTKYTVDLLSKSQTLDITAAREELGYVPIVSLDEGVVEFAKWWKEKNK